MTDMIDSLTQTTYTSSFLQHVDFNPALIPQLKLYTYPNICFYNKSLSNSHFNNSYLSNDSLSSNFDYLTNDPSLLDSTKPETHYCSGPLDYYNNNYFTNDNTTSNDDNFYNNNNFSDNDGKKNLLNIFSV